jgi:CII-binding regulator of phage lambda lysogenization HflD
MIAQDYVDIVRHLGKGLTLSPNQSLLQGGAVDANARAALVKVNVERFAKGLDNDRR